MITRGIVVGVGEVKVDTDKNREVVKYKVRMPLFNGSEDSPGSTPYEELQDAYIASTPGLYGTVNVGDSVYIGFIDNDYSNPVIVGTVNGDGNYLSVSSDSLRVLSSVTLPKNTVIGDITYEMLVGVIRWWRNGGATSSGGQSDVGYVVVNAPSGVFTNESLALLTGNDLSQIIYNNVHYTLAFKDGDLRKYGTHILTSDGKFQVINVSTATRAWTYSSYQSSALIDHINDTNVHIQSGERDYWNNKITCVKENETLVLTKENLNI